MIGCTQKPEVIYIDRIREDLLANQDDLNQRLNYFAQTRSHALTALEALDQPAEGLGVPFLIDAYQASQILPRGIRRDTYDEVVSVGANSAISDVAVRKRIANYYNSISAQITTVESVTSYRERIRGVMPYDVQAAIRSACDDIIDTNTISGDPTIALPESCTLELDPQQVSTAVTSILAADVRSDLIRRISDLDSKIVAAQLVIDRALLLNDYLGGIRQ